MIYDKFLVDEFSIIAIYNQVKELFPGERIFLFESVINNSDGNYSFIFIGEKERVKYENNKTYYFDGEKETILDTDPFSFFKEYYKKIDKNYYRELTKKLNIGFVDGFVGYIGYDMVKVFEPVLKNVMDNLKDETNIPDLYMIRPKIVLGYSHKSSTLTVIINDENLEDKLQKIKEKINSTYTHKPLKKIKILKAPEFVFTQEEFSSIQEFVYVPGVDSHNSRLSNLAWSRAKGYGNAAGIGNDDPRRNIRGNQRDNDIYIVTNISITYIMGGGFVRGAKFR